MSYHASDIGGKQFDVLLKLVEHLPKDKRFPAYDLLRCFLNHPECTKVFNGSDGGAGWLGLMLTTLDDPECHKASPMLCLRALCNMFKHGCTIHIMQ
jgi:hypothetical protein